jgi:hypothetical protein
MFLLSDPEKLRVNWNNIGNATNGIAHIGEANDPYTPESIIMKCHMQLPP